MTAKFIAESIMEIRRLSGLTWDELGDLFNVSRRSVHDWASGKPVIAKHNQMICRMLTAVRHLDRGAQISTRALLLAVDQTTKLSTLDLLKNGRFDQAMGLVESVETHKPHRTPLSREAQDARRPPPPWFFLEAKQDRPDIPARARAVRPKRTSGQ